MNFKFIFIYRCSYSRTAVGTTPSPIHHSATPRGNGVKSSNISQSHFFDIIFLYGTIFITENYKFVLK
jgi:hypothetical protein